MKRLTAAAWAMIAGAAIGVGSIPLAQAATADSIDFQATLSNDGLLSVTETIKVGDGLSSELDSIQQSLPLSAEVNGQRYDYVIDGLTVTADGQELDPSVTKAAAEQTISFPLADASTFVIEYTVTGATMKALDGNVDFSWTLLQGLNFDVRDISGRVNLPAGAVNYACSSGVVGALRTCATFSGGMNGDTGMVFTDINRLAGEALEVEVIFSEGSVAVTGQLADLWSL